MPKKFVTCRSCGERTEYAETGLRGFSRIDSKSGGCFYLCHRCANNQTRITSQRGKEVIGTPKAHGWRYGYELESTIGTPTLFLFDNNFKLKHDCSVKGAQWEWISPIYEGMSGIPKVLASLEEEVNLKHAVDSSCGTHIHISNHHPLWQDFITEMRDYYGDVTNEYYTLFNELTDYMNDNDRMTKKVWGRFFNSYCSDEAQDHERYHWLNPSRSHWTMEYRLARITSKEQFVTLECFDFVLLIPRKYHRQDIW